MSAVKILVVEDDSLIAEEMTTVLGHAGYAITGMVDNCEDALNSVVSNPPDIIFMDIMIRGGVDGIETARKLKEIGNFPIIFLTNLHDKKTLERAHQLNPANFLAKPFTTYQLLVSIQYALLNFSESKQATLKPDNVPAKELITLPHLAFIRDHQGNYKKQEIAEILFIEADRAYCTIHTADEKFVQSANMTSIWEKLNYPHFIQVSRSHVVNLNKIERLKGNVVVVNGIDIAIGRLFREAFFKHLNLVR